ncbi:hypothetical protein H0H92_000316 [Tricholoma furcatifolium]|nr:hypothetical protein H0H92_000316 [Tricholoma furcatifolium]
MLVDAPVPRQSNETGSTINLQVMDTYRTSMFSIHLTEADVNISAAIVVHGLISTAPLKPHFAFSTRVVELYCMMSNSCPHLTIELFVKSLCNLHCVPFRKHLAQQFTIAFDLYIAI